MNRSLLLDYPSITITWPESLSCRYGWPQLYKAGRRFFIRVRLSKPLYRTDTGRFFQHVLLEPHFVDATPADILFKSNTGVNVFIPAAQSGTGEAALNVVAWGVVS